MSGDSEGGGDRQEVEGEADKRGEGQTESGDGEGEWAGVTEKEKLLGWRGGRDREGAERGGERRRGAGDTGGEVIEGGGDRARGGILLYYFWMVGELGFVPLVRILSNRYKLLTRVSDLCQSPSSPDQLCKAHSCES